MHAFLSSADYKKIFRNTIRVSNSLDPDQARQNIRPDMDPNCLQRFSSDDTIINLLGKQNTLDKVSPEMNLDHFARFFVVL